MRISFALLFALGLAPLCARAEVTAPQGYDVYVLGEVHDNPLHHKEQARLVSQISPAAIVWEMLAEDQAKALVGADFTDAAKLEQMLQWEDAGWPDFAMYHPIFLAGQGAEHLAGAAPRDKVKASVKSGAVAMLDGVFAGFDPVAALPKLSDTVQKEREDEQAEAHCNALPAEILPGMVEAQRLRDAWMAAVSMRALDEGKAPIVVITGSGHARKDVGIAAVLAAVRPEVKVWSLGQAEADPGSDAPYDAVNVTEPAPRDDPCAVFQK